MKKLVLITGIILIACVLTGSFAAPRQVFAAPDAVQTETRTAGYVIGDSGGKIAVFYAGSAHPLLTTDTLTESLPRADAKKVRAGIRVASKKEAEKLLEDFCS